ncbi:MAG: hypothetical protein DKT66_11120 [Candidatus Melainabacteria bacterium]|nr:MAG: hypothetical protein DKT66_11120 [Candidatus Melainabacteria bacterium]
MNFQKAIFYSSVAFTAMSKGLGLVVFSAVSFFVALWVVSLTFFSSPERLIVFETVYSPDRKLKAVVFGYQFRPGFKNVSVLSAAASPEINRDGNVFSEVCKRASAKWRDNQNLVILTEGLGGTALKSKNFIAFDRGIEIDIRDLKGN